MLKHFNYVQSLGAQEYAVQYNMMFQTLLHWLMQIINQSLDSQNTLHTSPSRSSYGVSIVKILRNIHRAI